MRTDEEQSGIRGRAGEKGKEEGAREGNRMEAHIYIYIVIVINFLSKRDGRPRTSVTHSHDRTAGRRGGTLILGGHTCSQRLSGDRGAFTQPAPRGATRALSAQG